MTDEQLVEIDRAVKAERDRIVSFIRDEAQSMATKVIPAEHAHDTLCRIQARYHVALKIENLHHHD